MSPRRGSLAPRCFNELTDILRRWRSDCYPVLDAIVLGSDVAAVSDDKQRSMVAATEPESGFSNLDGPKPGPCPRAMRRSSSESLRRTVQASKARIHMVRLLLVVDHILLLAVDPAS